ncbi:DUF6297 family protein [Luteococcus sp. OSA5]|uniref:DUF6297 family protein n=1 Tax=Luteococcus sp. OSA5 TaxID=3401630 RepID=UPI003B427FB1
MSNDVAAPLVARDEVDERQLLLLMGDWRQGRANRNLRQALGDAYVAVFAVVMIGAMLTNVVINAQQMAATCTTSACLSGRGLLPWAAMFGTFVMALAASAMFGPVLASAAEGFWLLDAPLRRSRLLVRRLLAALVVALLGGALLGALVTALTGSPLPSVLAWSAATGLGSAGLVAFAAAEQGRERTWAVRGLQTVAGLAVVLTLLAVMATATGRAAIHMADGTARTLAFGVAVAGAVVMVVFTLLARARLDHFRRARLLSGGSLASGMQGAMFALDFGLMRDILVEREALQRGSVRPTRGRGVGTQALVWRDLQRLLRFPRPLMLLAVSALVPYAVQALGLGALNAAISALVLMAALIPFFGSLRVLTRTRGLARSLPWSTSQLRTAASVVPTGLAAVWSLAVAPAFLGIGTEAPRPLNEGVLVALVCGAAGLVAAIRWVSAQPADFSKPMLSTSAGAMPPGLAMNLLRGFDMVALITLPVVFGLSPWVSLVLAAVAFSILRMGGLDAEELQAQKEENERLLAQAKQEREPQVKQDRPPQTKQDRPPQARRAVGEPAQPQARRKVKRKK